MTGCFVHGFFAGVKLPCHGLETAGAPPALSVIPAGALKGGRLAVVAAAAAAAPRASNYGAASAKREIEEHVKMFHEIFKKTYKMEKDMPFREDIEKIDEYEKAMTSWNTSIFHIEATTFSLYLCMIAAIGVKLASKVMNSAGLRLDKQDGISSYTTKQTLMKYVSIFVKLAKDTYDKKFNDESNFSLLGAFRGVAAVGYILLQDALENANGAAYSYSLMLGVDDAWCDFEQKMNSLEERFRAVSKSTKAYEILMPTMVDVMILSIFFISEVVVTKRVLGYAPGRRVIRASDDGEPNASGPSSGKDGAN